MFHDSWSKYDGSGSSIHIPTLIVNPPYGRKLWNLAEGQTGYDDGKRVVLKAEIEIANQDSTNSLSYSLYYGSVLDLDEQLILDLYSHQYLMQ